MPLFSFFISYQRNQEQFETHFVSSVGHSPFDYFFLAQDIPSYDSIPETIVICQGERLKLQCANGSTGLVIYSAFYGRTEPGHVICPYPGDKQDYNYNCGEVNVTFLFKTMCQKKSRCKVKVNSALFGDPCPGKHLYLNLVYACGKFALRLIRKTIFGSYYVPCQ